VKSKGFRAGVRTPAFPKRGPDAGTTDQVRSQKRWMAQTTRNIDWPTYPLKPHQVAASAPTPDRSTTPAERMTREWRDDLTNPGPLQKPFLTRCGSRLCIAASDTMWFVRGDERRSSSTEIIPDGKLLAILAT
jgi:hypothetical protein